MASSSAMVITRESSVVVCLCWRSITMNGIFDGYFSLIRHPKQSAPCLVKPWLTALICDISRCRDASHCSNSLLTLAMSALVAASSSRKYTICTCKQCCFRCGGGVDTLQHGGHIRTVARSSLEIPLLPRLWMPDFLVPKTTCGHHHHHSVPGCPRP